MQNVDILIIVEHLVRELESACLLKYEFEKRGYRVAVDSIYPNKEKLPFRYQANCVFIPWAYHDQDMNFWECFYHANPNAMIINLHHEQYSGNDQNNATLPQGRAKNIFHLSWGERFTQGLIDEGVALQRIIPAGNLRLDFYRPPLTKLSAGKEQLARDFNLDDKQNWVLFIANAYHLMRPGEIENARRIDKDIDPKCQAAISSREQFLNLVRRYLSNSKDKIFIYRPHPAYAQRELENPELLQLCRQFPDHFKVIYAKSLRDWILASQCCLSFHSTSGIECSLAKIPFYLFRMTPLDANLDYAFYQQFPNIIHTENDFIQVMQTGGVPVDPGQFAHHYYMPTQPVYQTLVDWVETHSENEAHSSPLPQRLKTYFKSSAKEALRFLACRTPGLPLPKDGRWTRLLSSHDDLLEPAMVQQLCCQIKTIMEESV